MSEDQRVDERIDFKRLGRRKFLGKAAVAGSAATLAALSGCGVGSNNGQQQARTSSGGDASFVTILWAVPGVIIGGQIGPRISERVNDRILKEVFIFLLTLIGIHLIYNSY